ARLELWNAGAFDFRSGASDRAQGLCHSLLRTHRDSSAGATYQRPEALRCHGPIPSGGSAEGAPDGIQSGRDSTAVLWFSPDCYRIGPMEKAFGKEARRPGIARRPDQRNAKATEEHDGPLPLRCAGSVWERNIPEAVRGRVATSPISRSPLKSL